MEIREIHFEDAYDVKRKLNTWADKGYNLKDYFIQIASYGIPAMHDYIIFYDSRLDE